MTTFSANALEGRVALVTGTSRGIGAAILEAFVKAGATVVGTATSEAGAERITARIAELQGKCVDLETKIADQYDRINAIKLDKAVFEATMTQFTSIQYDLREMRADIKELLKNKQ